MPIRPLLAKVRSSTVAAISRRNTILRDSGPIVSFTFDDFPRSALEVGGTILKSYGAHGTYYAAMGLMGTASALGQQFCATDLELLQREGHELGSHTFKHVSCRSVFLREFEAEATKGRESVAKVTGVQEPHNFAYPYGHVTLRAKASVGRKFTSCRGISPGINRNPVDLNLLKANRLYSQSINFETIQNLLELNDEVGGWLIFYTHDVADVPSNYGCKPADFEKVVRLVSKRRCKILKVAEVISVVDPLS
jgi:peptidoglycan/xylan/chitin deacetylase (PgdA/CDA1 family)